MQISDYFYTEDQAANQLGINRITIWRWIKAGKLNVQKVGNVVFIPKEEINTIKTKENNCFTIQQAAEYLGITRQTVSKLINMGKFNIQRVGRKVLIPKEEIDSSKQTTKDV